MNKKIHVEGGQIIQVVAFYGRLWRLNSIKSNEWNNQFAK